MSRTPLDRVALVFVIIGAINWLLVGLFQFDLVAQISPPPGLNGPTIRM
jgi:uncharacterized membrane protein YuzA (DUF378 family)